MKTYMCDSCGHINQIEDFNENTVCSNCKAPSEKLRLIEDQIAENEIDAIINSVIENLTEEKEEKIINKEGTEDNKFVEIEDGNPCVKRLLDKCINCGQCKKVCEKNANMRYDLNKCLNPICIGCGECIRNCPSNALVEKEDYVEIKEVIDKNEKIVVSIVEPNVSFLVANHYGIPMENFEYKLNNVLKIIGFDYCFNSGLGCDINTVEEVSEFIERLKSKQSLPLITGNCPSITKYIEVYHPEVVNNISTVKAPLYIQSELIKENFCKDKGFNKEKIVTVGITSCLSNKMKLKEENNSLDYVMTVNELIKLMDIEEVNLKTLVGEDYEDYSKFSTSSRLLDLCGGKSEIFIKTFCKLVNRTKKSVNEIDESQFMNVSGKKELAIQIGDYKLRIAIVNSIYELDYLINTGKYKQFHFIEVMLCKNGCLDGNGYKFENKEDMVQIKEIIYKSVNNYPFDNDNVKKIYSSGLSKPLSEKALEILHEKHDDKSNNLTNL